MYLTPQHILIAGASGLTGEHLLLAQIGHAHFRRAATAREGHRLLAPHRAVIVREGKGNKDRVTVLPENLIAPLRAFERPLLGVCLGQQLLFERSDEGDGVELLGFIPGAVKRLEPAGDLPVPHMGWSRLTRDHVDPLLAGVEDGAYAYFVHGFVCPDGPATVARADYGGPVPAVVRSANRWGCQFHPERSAQAGATILKNFLGLPA